MAVGIGADCVWLCGFKGVASNLRKVTCILEMG